MKMVFLLFLFLDSFSAFHKLFTSVWSPGQFSAFRKGKLSAIACSCKTFAGCNCQITYDTQVLYKEEKNYIT